jgi:hypothetical protein
MQKLADVMRWGGIETMRFGDDDARMRWTWILKLVVMG